MLFKTKHVHALRPVLFRLRQGYLLGLAADPHHASPCAGCVERWLRERQVWVERAEVSELTLRRELIAELLAHGSAHRFYEIATDGSATEIEGAVFPHPDCECRKEEYEGPEAWSKKTNFAFSPVTQIKCSRFSLPEGNLWLSSALGAAPLSGDRVHAFGAAKDREPSRFSAVEEWLKQAAVADAPLVKGPREGVLLQSGRSVAVNRAATRWAGLGIGETEETARIDALVSLAKRSVLAGYATSMKHPMLVVGTNNWVRSQAPFYLMQQFDLHLLFYPTSMPIWVVGIVALSRKDLEKPPVFVFGAAPDIACSLEQAFARLVARCRPADFETPGGLPNEETRKVGRQAKLHLWWTHWIYRSPKVALRDLLHLESYAPDLNLWRSYFQDGQPPVTLVPLNHPSLPTRIRWVFGADAPQAGLSAVSNVNGIGTWMAFRDALS